MLPFRNGFEYRNSNLQVLNGTIFATFGKILMKITQLTVEITQGVSVFLGRDGKNRYIIPNISARTGQNFTKFSALVGSCMQIIKMK